MSMSSSPLSSIAKFPSDDSPTIIRAISMFGSFFEYEEDVGDVIRYRGSHSFALSFSVLMITVSFPSRFRFSFLSHSFLLISSRTSSAKSWVTNPWFIWISSFLDIIKS